MDHHNVIDHQGDVHEGVFNGHTGFLIELACGAGRYEIVYPYAQLDPARITKAPVSCLSCKEITAAGPGSPLHAENVAREHAEAVLALADHSGRSPALDNEGLRLAFETLSLTNPPTGKLYPLIREHLATKLTERALAVPEGIPEVLAVYHRYTGGAVHAPIGVGDRLMRNGIASGHWPIVEVTAIEDTPSGIVVSVSGENERPVNGPAVEVTRWFLKLDRGPRERPSELR
jgi:hypothetical protein